MKPSLALVLSLLSAAGCAAQTPTAPDTVAQVLLFEEGFEDQNWEMRGWYDGPHMQITDQEHIPGSQHACVWHWAKAGAINTEGGAGCPCPRWRASPWSSLSNTAPIGGGPGGAIIRTNSTLSPMPTRTMWARPRLAIQDGANIDEERLDQDLVGVTEARAVAGCNGNSDGRGEEDCYKTGEVHANGKYWQAERIYFGESSGSHYKGNWHQVWARFKLNSIVDGIGVKDGELHYWLDGKKLLDERQVVFRTGQHPDMKIDQLLMTPYFGPGVPREQRIWIDDLRIYTDAQ